MEQEQKSSNLVASINLLKGFVGLGITALTYGVSKTGWILGIIYFLLCGTSMIFMSYLMIQTADKIKSKARNIVEFANDILGVQYKHFFEFGLCLLQIGTCVSYFVFFTTYLQLSTCYLLGEDQQDNFLCTSRFPSLIFSLILVFPNIFIRNMTYLKYVTIIANILILKNLTIIIVYCFIIINKNEKLSEQIVAFNFQEFGQAIGLFLFAFEGQTLFFDIRSSMKEPLNFKYILLNVLFFSLSFYTFVALLGYFAFPQDTNEILLFNFSQSDPLFAFVQISYCTALLLSYPLQMFPVVNMIEIKIREYIEKKNEYVEVNQNVNINENVNQNENENENEQIQLNNEQIDKKVKFWSYIIRIWMLIFVFLTAILFKKISVLIGLVGSMASPVICFILPYVGFKKFMADQKQWKHVLVLVLMIFGCTLSVYGIYIGIIEFYRQYIL